MNLQPNVYYQRYQPKPGSELYRAIEAVETARQAAQKLIDGIATMEAARGALAAELEAMSWQSSVDDIVAIQQKLLAYDQLLHLAKVEKQRLNELRRLANIPSHKIANDIETQERLIRERREWIVIHGEDTHVDKLLPKIELEIELAQKEIERLKQEYC